MNFLTIQELIKQESLILQINWKRDVMIGDLVYATHRMLEEHLLALASDKFSISDLHLRRASSLFSVNNQKVNQLLFAQKSFSCCNEKQLTQIFKLILENELRLKSNQEHVELALRIQQHTLDNALLKVLAKELPSTVTHSESALWHTLEKL